MSRTTCEQTLCSEWDECEFEHDTKRCLHSLDVNADPLIDRGVPLRRSESDSKTTCRLKGRTTA